MSDKKDREYWTERFEQLEQSQHDTSEQYFHDLEEMYQDAAKDIEKDIAKWYTRYATENGISYSEAMRILNSNELKELRMSVEDYVKKGKLVSDEFADQLEAASIKYHVSRLEALQVQMQQRVDVLMGNEIDHISSLSKQIYTDGYYKTAYELMKGTGVGFEFMKLDANKVNKIISKHWAADGKNFSKRIWGDHRPALIDKLQKGLSQSIMRGQPPDKLIKDIAKTFKVAQNKAANLVYTESAFFNSASQKDTFNELGVKEFENVATLDRRTSEKCRFMDGKHFPMTEHKVGYTAPPYHQRCRTVTAPWFPDDDLHERAARDNNGNYYTIPGNMTYPEWQKHYIDGGTPKNTNVTKHDKIKLPDDEEHAIRSYTSSEAYKLNDALRNNYKMDDYLKGIMNNLDTALKKIPVYTGGLQTRSVEFYTTAALNKFMSNYIPGNELKYKEYLSTTIGNIYNPDAQVQIYIFNGKHGQDITPWNNGEKEILYERDNRFKVKAVENINGVYHIELEELPNE